MMKFTIFVLVLFCCLQTGYSQCASGTSFGEQTPSSKSNAFDGKTNSGYLLLGNTNGYEIDCCGVVNEWKVFTDAAGTVNLQIWRPSGSGYELIGENVENLGTGDLNVPIPSGAQIAVRSGDRIGWWASTNVIKHKSVSGPDTTIWEPMTQPSVGDVITWAGASVSSTTSDTYAIGLTVDGGNAPVFSSPANGATFTVKNNDPVGLLVTTLTWADVDVGDTLTATKDTPTTQFTFDQTSGQLTVSSSLAGPTTTVTLGFTVKDYCGNTDTLSITITIENDPPVLHDLPVSYFLSEDSAAQTLLYTINATDTADTVSCAFDPSVPGAYPFTVQLIPGSSNYGIYVNSNPGFDYDTISNYPLTVVCNDGYLNSNTGTFYVYLVENQTPVIHNLQGATTLSTTAVIGTTVFTVNATDNEGDAITFTMTCSPTTCPFDIFDSGQIQLNADISSYTTTGYDISIVVSDPKNTAVAKILTVIIQDINDPVLITNLPLTSSYSVPENTPLSSSVFTVSISDQDAQTWTYSMSSTPGTGLSYFSLDSAGLISTSGSLLDYETLSAAGTTSFTFTITVNDGTASDTVPLVIDVINVNEAPTFAQASYSLSHAEGSAGTVIGTPSFGVTDPDSGDSYTYSMDCGNNTPYFLMNPSTGQVSFQSDYDTDAGLPTSVTCTVTVTDTGSLNDTATLQIVITDVNDNMPVFSPASYSFFISYYASVGTAVGTVTATDGDTGSFGTITMTLDQTSLLDEYFAIDNNGQIVVKKTPNGNAIGYATSVTVTAIASDGGGQSDTATVTIVISDTTTTSTTTTTDRYKTFIEDNRNVAWLVACIVLLLITCAVLTWLICTCTGVNGCRTFKKHFWQRKKKTWRPRERYKSLKTPPPLHKQSPGFVIVRQPPPPKSEQAWRSSAV